MFNYYQVEIKGKNINRFLERIIKEKINIFDIHKERNKITFKTDYFEYEKLIKINTTYEITIKNIKGVNKYKSLIKFYKTFLIFFAIFLILIVIYSNMVFKININTDNEELKAIIKEELKDNNISIFTFKKSFNELENIISKIKLKTKEKIEWLAIKEHGVIYDINVIEKINKSTKKDRTITNIVAKENGYIKDMYIKHGQVLKNNGDYVTKGELIVSGYIKKEEDIKNTVHAEGDIYAEVWYKVSVNGDKKFYEQKNNKGELKIIIEIFNKKIKLLTIDLKKIKQEVRKTILSNDLFKLQLEKSFKENLVEVKYSDEILIKNLENEAKKEIEKTLENKEKILLQKTLKNTIDNDKIYLEVFFKVYKNIALSIEAKEELNVGE